MVLTAVVRAAVAAAHGWEEREDGRAAQVTSAARVVVLGLARAEAAGKAVALMACRCLGRRCKLGPRHFGGSDWSLS